MEKHPQNNLKETLQEKLYNARVDAEDLPWSEFKPKLVSRKSTFWGYISVLGRVAAAILLAGLVSYFTITNSDSTSPEMITRTTEEAIEIQEGEGSSGQESGKNYTANAETKENLSETEEEGAQPIATKNYPSEGSTDLVSQKELATQKLNKIIGMETVFGAVSEIEPVLLNSGHEYIVSGDTKNYLERGSNGISNVSLANASVNASSYSFAGRENNINNKERSPGFNKIVVGFKPLMQYNQVDPVKNDLIYLNKIQGSNSVIDRSRIGLNIYTAVEADLSKVFSIYSGVSYLFQRNNVQFEAISIISNDIRELRYNVNSHSFGLLAGVKAKLFEKNFIVHSLVIENEYQKTLTRSEFVQPDRLTMSLGYELAFRYSSSSTLNVQPVFVYSFKESTTRAFTSKPYWIGLKFSLTKNIY